MMPVERIELPNVLRILIPLALWRDQPHRNTSLSHISHCLSSLKSNILVRWCPVKSKSEKDVATNMFVHGTAVGLFNVCIYCELLHHTWIGSRFSMD